jgi:hypothetical protein
VDPEGRHPQAEDVVSALADLQLEWRRETDASFAVHGFNLFYGQGVYGI